ncbi:MAG: hypothetical protein AAFY20_00630 [Cyanobacteria bacterium J06639_14]
MPTVTFYPTGNADTCLIGLDNGRKIVFDYANTYDPSQESKYIDLEKEIRQASGRQQKVDVLAISHLDKDHYKGASTLFELEHAKCYQGDDRIKIDTLWVPAAAILEEGITEEGRILRSEARYRLKQGKGIRVFSRPDALEDWLIDNGTSLSARRQLITDAGEIAPEFTLVRDGIEFFVHSPFAERAEDGGLIVRNDSALFMQATFDVLGRKTRLILSADCPWEILEGIIHVTKAHNNEERLQWDINNIPHHCSYLSLAEDKGERKTIPSEDIQWLYEEQGERHGLLISTSDLIPAEDTKQPPHRQAAAYYEDAATKIGGEFLVTMKEPSPHAPKPMIIEITGRGHKYKKSFVAPAIATSTQKPPRAG